MSLDRQKEIFEKLLEKHQSSGQDPTVATKIIWMDPDNLEIVLRERQELPGPDPNVNDILYAYYSSLHWTSAIRISINRKRNRHTNELYTDTPIRMGSGSHLDHNPVGVARMYQLMWENIHKLLEQKLT